MQESLKSNLQVQKSLQNISTTFQATMQSIDDKIDSLENNRTNVDNLGDQLV